MRFSIHLWCFLCLSTIAADLSNTNRIPKEAIIGAEQLLGLDFADTKLEMSLPGLREQLDKFQQLRGLPLSNSVPPCLWFDPLPAGTVLDQRRARFRLSAPPKIRLP